MTRRSRAAAGVPVLVAFGAYLAALALVSALAPWQRAFDDFFYIPETLRWLAAGRLGSDGVFLRVPLWNLLLGAHFGLFGVRLGIAVLQGLVVLGALGCIAWAARGQAERASPGFLLALLLVFALCPQVLLYSRQAVNELFLGWLSMLVILSAERRAPGALLRLGALVATACMTKPIGLLLAIPALAHLGLVPAAGRGRALGRLALGFLAVALPLALLAICQRGLLLLDNTSAFNLSGMDLGEWRALGDPEARYREGMARWWARFSGAPLGYLAGAAGRLGVWLARPSSADFAHFYASYPTRALALLDALVLAGMALLALAGSRRRDAAVWLYLLGLAGACAFPLFTPYSPKVMLLFPLALLAVRGGPRLLARLGARGAPAPPASGDPEGHGGGGWGLSRPPPK